MFNMYDISAPQQGGADFDGDIFLLCDEPIVIDAKIDKKIILDIEDKLTVKPKPYTKENIVEDVDDSKKISAKKREYVYNIIISKALSRKIIFLKNLMSLIFSSKNMKVILMNLIQIKLKN